MLINIATIQGIEIDYRIADELPGGVKRDVAAPPDLEEFDLEFAQTGLTEAQMRSIRAASQCDDFRMFEEEEPILRATRESIRNGRVL